MSDSSFERWRALVDKGLQGAPFESLTATTLEGIAIAPLYTERDRPESEGIPWAPRAPRAMGPMMLLRDGLDLDAEQRGGATAAHLWVGDVRQLAVPDGMTVVLDGPIDHAVAMSSERARSLADPWWVQRVPGPRATTGRPTGDAAVALVAEGIQRGGAALGASAALWSMWQRADAVESIALALASLMESLRRLEGRGVDLESAVRASTIAIDTDTDFFLDVAKLRAARRIFDCALSASGISARPVIAGHTSERSRARMDTSTNLLRFTIGAAAALIGGADVVCVRPHAWSQDVAAVPTETARKVPLVLALESHLAAAADPSRGSPYLEALTEAVASRAWEWFREIESLGGIERAYPKIFERLARSREALERATATRRRPLVGVSRFPLVGPGTFDGLLSQAHPFETLRLHAAPAARVITLGTCPDARAAFAREVAQLAAARVDVVHVDVAQGVALGDASFVILGAADAEVATLIPDAARALRAAGARAIAVAGKPGPHEPLLRDAGVDTFVYVGADLVTALETLLERAGGKAA